MNDSTIITAPINNAYERKMLLRVVPNWHYGKFAATSPITRNGGTATIKLRRYANLSPVTTPLIEGTNPAGVTFTITDVTATVATYGNYVILTDVVDWMTVNSEAFGWTNILSDNALDTLDCLMRDVATSGTAVMYGGAATTTGTVGASDKLTGTLIKKIVRALKNQNARRITEYSPTDDGVDTVNLKECYIGICSPSTTYDLKADSAFIDVEKYSHNADIMPGEIGKVDEVRFIETTNAKVLTGLGSGGIDVHATVILGQEALGRSMITGEDLRMINKPLGSAGTMDALNMIATMGWKTTFVGFILNDQFLYRAEHAVSA